MKNHLKRIAAPRTWTIDRKEATFLTKPKPGGQVLDSGLPLGRILRDNLKLVLTMREVKKILNNKEIFVDGKRRKDHRLIVGLFDVLAVPEYQKYYRLLFDRKGKIILKEIPLAETGVKLCKITGKKVLAGGKVQYSLHDGRTICPEKDAKVGDTFIFDLKSKTVTEILPLRSGMQVYFMRGRFRGNMGIVKEIKAQEAICELGKQKIITAKDYLFVVGDKHLMITL